MNNFFGKLSHMKDALSKSGNIMNNVKKGVGALTVVTAASMGSGAMAGEGHSVDTLGIGPTVSMNSGAMAGDMNNVGKRVGALTVAKAVPINSNTIAGEWHTVDTWGIGPEAFCMQKFGNKNWKYLVDEEGRYVLRPDKDLIFGRKYTQKPVASGQSDTTATSAARIVSTPRPQPKPEARINIVSIGEKSEGNIKEKNDAQTNSLNLDKDLKNKPVTKAPKKFEILPGFDINQAIEKKNAEKKVSQVIQLKPEGRKNEELLCENPDSDKNSKIIKEVSQLDLSTLIAIPPKETSPKTQMGPELPGNIFSIEEARALRKPLENITAKQSSEQPRVIEKQSFLKKLFGLAHGDNLGLDVDVYKEAVAKIESGNKSYAARNDAIGKIKKIKPNKWAWGKYQFTTETLSGYGVSLKENGKISEKRVQEFLNDPDRQEGLMNEYIKKGLEIIKGKGKLLGTIEEGTKPLPAILAKGHIAGHGSMDKNENVSKNGKKKTDWLKTPISKYAKIVSDTYLSIIAKKEVIQKATDSENNIPTIQVIQPEFKMPTPTIQESKELIKPAIQAIGSENRDVSSLILAPELEQITITTPSANDTIFATQQVTQSVISPIDEKRIQIAKLSDIAQEHLKIAKDHRTEATRLRKESKNRFGNDWELNRKRLNKRAEAHETNAEAHENRANALNNTIMRMANNQTLKKAA